MVNFHPILAFLTALVKLLGRGSLKTLVGAWLLMKRFNLHMVAFFGIFVLPELLGAYQFLANEGVAWYYAIPAAFGVEAGGSVFTVFNNVMAIYSGDAGVSSIFLVIGVLVSLTTLFWYIWLWVRFTNLFGGFNPLALWTIGGIIFALMIVITLLVDNHLLGEETLRVAGFTYFLENPDSTLSSLEMFWDGFAQEPSGIDGNLTDGNMTDGGNQTE